MEDLPNIIERANRNKSGIGITCTVFFVRVDKRERRSALALIKWCACLSSVVTQFTLTR